MLDTATQIRSALRSLSDRARSLVRDTVAGKRYVYQPKLRVSSSEAAVELLSQRIPNRIVPHWPTPNEPAVLAEILAGFSRLGVHVQPLAITDQDHDRFISQIGYRSRYRGYYPHNRAEKTLEHHVAMRLLDVRSGQVFVDLASEGSALPDIVRRKYGAKVYAQDIMYRPALLSRLFGSNGYSRDWLPSRLAPRVRKIPGDACAMPIPDGFIDKAALTCSLEHFEGDADTRLFQELVRVVRPGGRVVVVPLYMYVEPAILTDPTYSATVTVPFDAEAAVYCCSGYNNRHGRFYSPESLIRRICAATGDAFRMTVYRLTEAENIKGVYARFALLAERV